MESATAPLIDHSPAFEQSDPMEDAPSRKRRLPRVRLGLLLVGLIAAGGIGGLLYLGAWPPMATVMSASMEPSIKTGDVVLLKHLDRAPRIGDVIAVRVPEPARSRYGYPPEVTHRVVKIAPNGQITTKGDARNKPDPFTVSRPSVQARVVATVPAAGRVLAFLTSTLGLVWLAGGVLLLIVLPLFERQRDMQEREEATLESLHAELRSISGELALLRSAPPPNDPYSVTVEMPTVEEMAPAVDMYMERFEAEFTLALDDLAREIEAPTDSLDYWPLSPSAASAGPHSSLRRNLRSE
jgi:signal peptidase I